MTQPIVKTTWPMRVGAYMQRYDAVYERKDGKIIFHDTDFVFKDDIKAMKGARWDGVKKVWSVQDCTRNQIQMDFLEGKNPLTWFDRPVQEFEYKRDLAGHQITMGNAIRTYHYQIISAVPGAGKTLPTLEALEAADLSGPAIWSCPSKNIEAIDAEVWKWKFKTPLEIVSHEELKKRVRDNFVPQFLVLDESHKFKTAATQRTSSGQDIADAVREEYGFDGWVILLTGTFSPNKPIDPWAQAEIAYPGFLKEGSPKALLRRLAYLEQASGNNGFYEDIIGWNEEEVQLMSKRLQGLLTVVLEEDLDWELPPIEYIRRNLPPDEPTKRVSNAIARTASSAGTAAMKLREISDGFNYIQEEAGMMACPACEGAGFVTEWVDPDEPDRQYKTIDMFSEELTAKLKPVPVTCFQCKGEKEVIKYKKVAYEVPCPKEDALRKDLKECEDTNRVLVFAGFRGSLDRCVRICKEEGWEVIRCDGRGFRVLGKRGERPLRYWMDKEKNPQKIAYVSHPESGATAFTLVESNVVIFYSNTHRHDHRYQGLKRVHRPGQERAIKIIDYCHLWSDYRVLDILEGKRNLEGMTIGEFIGDALDETKSLD